MRTKTRNRYTEYEISVEMGKVRFTKTSTIIVMHLKNFRAKCHKHKIQCSFEGVQTDIVPCY